MRILIVDDEVVIRKGLIKLLGMISHHHLIVDEAKNGEEALQKIVENQPDLLFTDIQMPIMNGLELVERVRDKYSNIEIVILTGYAEFEYVQRALRSSVTDYLLKPISQSKLEEVLHQILLKDPAKWVTEIDFTNIRKIKETALALVKSVASENKKELMETLLQWQAYCKECGFSLNEMKRMMGQMQLFYQSEIYQTIKQEPEFPSINQRATTVEQLIDYWHSILLEHMSLISENKSPKNKRIVEDALRLIHENYHDTNLNIKKLADHCGITSAYLSTIFRKVMNRPITQYMIEFRLEQAKQRIKTDYKAKIHHIAEECGFNDYPYFSKIFKKLVGLSPLEYREKNI